MKKSLTAAAVSSPDRWAISRSTWALSSWKVRSTHSKKQLVLIGVVVVHHALGDPVVPTDPLHVDLVVAVGPELL